MKIIITIIISYLFGAIPWAYLITKWQSGKDIRNEGSGNIGTLNSYEVSNNKILGVTVLLADILKAFVAIAVCSTISGSDSVSTIASGIFIILGHNYNIFLKFRGGRGLAPAVGIAIALNSLPLISWLFFWIIFNKFVKNIHLANAYSSIGTIILLWLIPSEKIDIFHTLYYISALDIRIQFTVINLLFIFAHYKPLKEHFFSNIQEK